MNVWKFQLNSAPEVHSGTFDQKPFNIFAKSSILDV